jgi:hypothetical protein
MESVETLSDGRVLPDRRRFTWRTVVFGYLRSRRRGHRRHDEREPVFSDWHHPWLFFLAIGIMLFSSLDAFLTLRLLDRGAIEVNPVMAAMLGHGHVAFDAGAEQRLELATVHRLYLPPTMGILGRSRLA